MTRKKRNIYCTTPLGCTDLCRLVQSAVVEYRSPRRSPIADVRFRLISSDPGAAAYIRIDRGWRRRHPPFLGLHACDLRGSLILPRAQPACSRPSRGTDLKSKREKFEKGRKGKNLKCLGMTKGLMPTISLTRSRATPSLACTGIGPGGSP